MRPRLREQGYLAVLARHSAGRRPFVSRARVWRNGLLYSAQTWPQMTPNRLPSSDAGVCRYKGEVGLAWPSFAPSEFRVVADKGGPLGQPGEPRS